MNPTPTRLRSRNAPWARASLNRRVHGISVAASLALVALSGAPARGHSGIDAVEHIFGATNVHAVTGHGGLTVGVAESGDVSVLVWPNPSYTDQLGYATSNAWDARDRPRFGAPEGAGLFLGLLAELGDGTRQVTWLRDAAVWEHAQSYAGPESPNPLTHYASAALGLEVTVVDAVDPERDVFVRDVTVHRVEGSAVTRLWLLTYANLSPTPPNHKIPELPIADWAYDGRDDFGAYWDAAADAVVHLHPADRNVRSRLVDVLSPPTVDYGPLGEALKQADPVAALSGVDLGYGPGAYLAFTTHPTPDQHHIGGDVTPFCALVADFLENLRTLPEHLPDLRLPIDPATLAPLACPEDAPPTAVAEGWISLPGDAFQDIQDGELSGGSVAAGEINEALRTPLEFALEGSARAQVVVAAAADAPLVLGLLDALDAAAVPARAEAAASAWLAPLQRPQVMGDSDVSERAVRVATRSILNLRVGLVRENGAIVASIARQPSYGLDWPRDGAFFNIALDVAGLPDEAARRTDFYVATQRREPVRATPFIDPPPPPDPRDPAAPLMYPAGAWEMNMYADGQPGGTWRFEIDNTAFALLTLVSHVGWAAEPEAHLRGRWEAIRLAADLLTDWRDPATGLHAPAQEDDNADYTQTLHGAVTVQGALAVAARAAAMLGETADAQRWRDRAVEVREAILTHLYDAEQGLFIDDPAGGAGTINPGSAASGPTAWLVWPMLVLPWDDARVQAQLAADLAAVTPIVTPPAGQEGEGGGYVLKNLLSLAVAQGQDPAVRAQIITLLNALADQATPGTDHFGEVFLWRPAADGAGVVADQRVSTPHLWEGILFYLTALALESPADLSRWDVVLPPLEDIPPSPTPDGGVSPDAGPADATLPPTDGAAPAPTDAATPPGDSTAVGVDAGLGAGEGGSSADTSSADDGCGCRAVSAGPGLSWALLVLAGPLLRRRRRKG